MILLESKQILLNNVIYPITRFEVWFRTPFGLHTKLEDAIEQCKANDWLPANMIVPVSVAIGPNPIYEVFI